jgi:hypothetical protein
VLVLWAVERLRRTEVGKVGGPEGGSEEGGGRRGGEW